MGLLSLLYLAFVYEVILTFKLWMDDVLQNVVKVEVVGFLYKDDRKPGIDNANYLPEVVVVKFHSSLNY